MQFFVRKKRQAPAVIIISLIDVLMVVLIFLLVTTSFKQQPAVKLALPSSKQTGNVSSEQALLVTIPKTGPLYLGTQPVTIEKLAQQFASAVKENPKTALSIRADTEAPFGQVVKVMDAAKAANLQVVNAYTKAGVSP
jgi:biopolymer transport protein ExbD